MKDTFFFAKIPSDSCLASKIDPLGDWYSVPAMYEPYAHAILNPLFFQAQFDLKILKRCYFTPTQRTLLWNETIAD